MMSQENGATAAAEGQVQEEQEMPPVLQFLHYVSKLKVF